MKKNFNVFKILKKKTDIIFKLKIFIISKLIKNIIKK